ncbi:hypothetical protein Pfo_023427, partial [Paulownia fortunei]
KRYVIRNTVIYSMMMKLVNQRALSSSFVTAMILIVMMASKSWSRSHPSTAVPGGSTVSTAANVAALGEQPSKKLYRASDYHLLAKRRVPPSGPSHKGHKTPNFARHLSADGE